MLKMRLLFLLIISVFASENEETNENDEPNSLGNSAQNKILVKIEEDEYTKVIIYEIRTEFWNVSKYKRLIFL